MALFGITRYLGEDEPPSQSDINNSQQDILKKLHADAAKRRKSLNDNNKSLPLLSEVSCEEKVKEQANHKAKRKRSLPPNADSKVKKLKSETPKDLELSLSDTPNDTEESNKIKAKSKKKKSKEPSSSEIAAYEQSCDDTTIKEKVKKSKLNASKSVKTNKSQDDSVETPDEQLQEEEDNKIAGGIKFQARENETGQKHHNVGGFTIIGSVKQQATKKVQRVLPEWLSKPSVITENLRDSLLPLNAIPQLNADLVERLHENGIKSFFPVQSQLLPVLLEDTKISHLVGSGGYRPCDICCSAPTGSGKTLAFVLPIVQALQNRVVRRVRALVVLPVRDLANQVYQVFTTFCKGTPLRVGLVTGQKNLSAEKQSLVKQSSKGLFSLVDIVVATPGRLVDHINQTPGFDLTNLRYLVIDEADRMMDETKQDWLAQVESAAYWGPDSNMHSTEGASSNSLCSQYKRLRPGPLTAASAMKMEIPMQKLLFSATLSQNPEKLHQLSLFQPRLFTSITQPSTLGDKVAIGEGDSEKEEGEPAKESGEFVGKFTTPAGLTEYFIEVTASSKPLIILYLIHHLKFKRILCFTNSVEATHRLYWLVKLIGGVEVCEFSSSLHAVKRNRIIKQFSKGKIDLLICSDAMARGMDIENVRYVISYDSPRFLKTYIHRVGRTARAGRVGAALTMLEKKEIAYFKRLLKESGKSSFKELKIKKADIKAYIPEMQAALKELPAILQKEKRI